MRRVHGKCPSNGMETLLDSIPGIKEQHFQFIRKRDSKEMQRYHFPV